MSTGPMLIFIDVDGTICDMKKDSDIEFLDLPVNYEGVKPYPERIKKVNDAYYSGAHITYWSARGCKSGEVKLLYDLTKKQLDEWGAKYHDLQIGNKPHFDVYICDKSHNADTWFEDKQEHMSTQEKIEEYQKDVLALVERYKKDIEENRLQYEAKNKKLVEKLQAAMEVIKGANPLEKLNIVEGQSVN